MCEFRRVGRNSYRWYELDRPAGRSSIFDWSSFAPAGNKIPRRSAIAMSSLYLSGGFRGGRFDTPTPPEASRPSESEAAFDCKAATMIEKAIATRTSSPKNLTADLIAISWPHIINPQIMV